MVHRWLCVLIAFFGLAIHSPAQQCAIWPLTKEPSSVGHGLTSAGISPAHLRLESATPNHDAAAQTSKEKPPKIAKPTGNDQQTFSLIIEPKSHPFCASGETENNAARKAEKDIRPFLLPDSCPKQGQSKTKYNWDLSSDPVVPAGWPALPSGGTCFDGKADILLERGYRYGFCDWTQYDIPLNSVKVPYPSFLLGDADYYLIHVVLWKVNEAEIVSDETKVVSGYRNFSPTSFICDDSEITVSTKNSQSRADNPHTYTFKAGTQIKDVLTSITDPKTKVEAKLEGGQIVISLPKDASVTGKGLSFGEWVNPIASVSYQVDSSRWYTYNRGDHGKLRQPLPLIDGTSLRVYGTKKPIGLITVHIRPKVDGEAPERDRELWENFQSLQVKYQIKIQKKVAANVADLAGAASIIFNKTGGALAATPPHGTIQPEGFYGATFFNAKAPSDITVDVEVDFPKPPKSVPTEDQKPKNGQGGTKSSADNTLQTPYQRVSGQAVETQGASKPHYMVTALLLSQTAQESPQKPSDQPTSKDSTNPSASKSGNAGASKSKSQVPTGPSVDCQNRQSPCKMEATYSNEDLYHWDISFGVPFTTLKEISYNSDTGGGSIVPKTVTRLNAYAFADIFPVAADIVSPPWLTMPHFVIGLPISGKVFNKPIFAVGEGFNLKKVRYLSAIPLQVQFFAGVAYNKEFRQIPGTTGSANVFPVRVWNGIYGVEIPVSQFKGLLGGKSKSTAQASAKPQPAQSSNGQSE